MYAWSIMVIETMMDLFKKIQSHYIFVGSTADFTVVGIPKKNPISIQSAL